VEEKFSRRSKLSLVSSQDSGNKSPVNSDNKGSETSSDTPSTKSRIPRSKLPPSKESKKSKPKISQGKKNNNTAKVTPLRVVNGGALNQDQNTPIPATTRSRPSANLPKVSPNTEAREAREARRDRESLKTLDLKSSSRKSSISEPPKTPIPRDTKNRVPAKRVRRRPTSPLVQATRYLILGVGIAVIAGTVLSAFNSLTRPTPEANNQEQLKEASLKAVKTPIIPQGLKLNQEITELKTALQSLASKNATLTPGVFLFDVDTGNYVDFNGDTVLGAASTIKTPILAAFFQAIDEGKVRLDDKVTLKKEHIGGGSGELQDQKPGKQFSALEVANKMIVISDNTATNMLIDLLGGIEILNDKFKQWGLTHTQLQNLLPDLAGTNKTTAKDLVNIMALMNQGQLISLKSRDRALNIMTQTANNTLLPKGLEKGATIAHKTGTIDTIAADVGIIDMPNGKRYLLGVIVQHPKTKRKAEKFIQDVSSLIYQHFNEDANSTSKLETIKETGSIPLPVQKSVDSNNNTKRRDR
jgi:beta-lactamase class A